MSAQNGSAVREIPSERALRQESEHRIKNHLQLIGAGLAMQARECADASARLILLQACGRVSAVARLHERFQNMTQTADVELADFLTEVCADLTICLNAGDGRLVELEVQIQSAVLPAPTALTVGLIVSELVTNAVKHGGEGVARVRVGLRREHARWLLEVRDNGPGMAPEALEAGSGLGARVLKALTGQLGGSLRVEAPEQGACVVVLFG